MTARRPRGSTSVAPGADADRPFTQRVTGGGHLRYAARDVAVDGISQSGPAPRGVSVPRSDLLLGLVRAGSRGDQTLFRRSLEAIVAEERAKQHHVLAGRLEEFLRTNGDEPHGPARNGLVRSSDPMEGLLYESVPRRRLEDLILPAGVQQSIRDLVEEHQRSDLLATHGLEPRHRLLLTGPPGNGKTTLAEAIAEALMLPLLTVRYEGVIGSYLGETALRLRRVFDHVRTRPCVLFIDEFDTLGKERGDPHDTGEVKRVVSSLLLQIDDLPSYVVVVTATNHPELLDRAVWRRFQLRLELPPPSADALLTWVANLEGSVGEPLGVPPAELVKRLSGLSFSDLEQIQLDILRTWILSLRERPVREVIRRRLGQLDRRRQSRALGVDG